MSYVRNTLKINDDVPFLFHIRKILIVYELRVLETYEVKVFRETHETSGINFQPSNQSFIHSSGKEHLVSSFVNTGQIFPSSFVATETLHRLRDHQNLIQALL